MTDNRELIEQLRTVFFEEAEDGLAVMESGLLRLDQGERDPELINSIFRAAHSIKGGSGTFGLDELVDFTHCMETLLDRMRSQQHPIDAPTISVLLQSVDYLRVLLQNSISGGPNDDAETAEMQAAVQAVLDTVDRPPMSSATPPPPAPAGRSKRYRIGFAPSLAVMRRGNNPALMLRELRSMGTARVQTDLSALPPLSEMDPEAFYLRFSIELETAESEAAIRDVFVWVEDEADIDIRIVGAADDGLESVAAAATAPPATSMTVEAAPSLVSASDAPPTSSQTASASPVSPAPAMTSPASAAASPVPAAASPAPASPVSPAPAPATTSPAPAAASPTPAAASPAPAATSCAPIPRSPDAGSIRVGIEKIDALINLVGELVITQSMLGQIEKTFDMTKLGRLRDGLSELERNTRQLQESVMRIRMLPIRFVFSRLPRMVRDLSVRLDKQIKLTLAGEGTELDKTVMEKIGDPLVHLVRNAIDHGIEVPEARREAGKPPEGSLDINAYHQGGSIVIEVRDDGGGLDERRILKRAISRGLVDPGEKIPPERVFDFIFHPGFSTKEEVSDVSGRGVGLDVVRRNIRELGGHIEVSSQFGIGTTFTIRLPLTLAILDGQLVQIGEQRFVVPLVAIVETIEMEQKNVSAVAGRSEVYRLHDEYIPIVRLYDVFGIRGAQTELQGGLLTVVEGSGQRAGIMVDDLLDQQQVVIKSLESNFRQVEGVSGATILGDGTVALILDTSGLINFTMRQAARQNGPPGNERAAWS